MALQQQGFQQLMCKPQSPGSPGGPAGVRVCTRERVSLCLRALRLSERPHPLLACPDITVSNVSSGCSDPLQPGQACLGVTLTHPYPAPNPNLPWLPASCQRPKQIWKAIPGVPPGGEGYGTVKTQEQPE